LATWSTGPPDIATTTGATGAVEVEAPVDVVAGEVGVRSSREGPHVTRVAAEVLRPVNETQAATGIDRAAGWLADAGYEVVDAEPPQIGEATAVTSRWVRSR